MSTVTKAPPVVGALCGAVAVFCFSVNDMAIKFLSGDYALHEVILLRSLCALVLILAVVLPVSGGLSALKTRRPGLHAVRGLCVVVANMAFFLGVAALPLADAVAIFFVSPLLITAFSVIFLGETVGPRRWAAIALGLAGVLIVLRPGTSAFQPAALLPLLGATGYAGLHTFTRRLGTTDSAATMAVYIQLSFILVSGTIGLAIGDGRFTGWDSPSLEFFFRGWTWPAAGDWPVIGLVGLCSGAGGFFISQAYRISEAALVAPMEYIAMPMAVIWGVTIFGEWPDLAAWCGIVLIVGSGLFLIWRETQAGREAPRPRLRR
ncbi:DMT family transporter [Psychromarinibacter sp. C21-152]|uniref:DMT family transporter n=1 Tax=Psychromarinibacter sediminicola TaxID=3033385 RepID=A0AAE3NQP1_9RHOB|nr:DMT family transporter [Psychromarinibacter sediminicola]MDF0600651.1 DMT family transporter [Psychromarinibacter sediminicola]